MEKFCDLHVHSHFSDGTCSPLELIGLAEAAGLTALALCDHNTIDGLPDFLAAGENAKLETVPGIEFSTDYEGVELHILGLYIPESHYGAINELMEEQKRRKEQSNIELVAALNRAGYDIDYEAIKATTPNGFVNRALVAAELTRKGYTESIQAAFRQLLSPKVGYYQPPQRPDSYEIIRLIKEMGAVAVLAHPFLNLDEAALRRFLPRAVECGLDAMEVLYPKYDEETTRLAKQMAEEFGLLPSGGSDFHGSNKPDIQIGIGRGNLRVPAQYLEDMKQKNIREL